MTIAMVTKTKIGKIAKPTLKPYIKRFANKYKLSKTINNLCLIDNFYFIEENWWRNWYLKYVTMETVKHFEIVFFTVFLISRNGKLLDFASVSISMKCTFIYEDCHPLLWEQGQKMEKTEKLKVILMCFNSRFQRILAIVFVAFGTWKKYTWIFIIHVYHKKICYAT